MLDKNKYKNWEKGDIFALEIKKCNHQEYIGKFLLLIYLGDEGYKNLPSFRVKITENIPKTKNEVETLEYIKTIFTVLEKAYPVGVEVPKNVELFPDEYGYLHTYKLCIYTTSFKHKIRNDLIYIGNFDLSLPSNEYNPWIYYNIPMCFWKDVENFVIESYIKYNLRDPEIYNFECASMMHKKAKEVNELIVQTLKESNFEKFKDEKYTSDTLTYVGGDIKHPDYEELNYDK